MQLEWYIDWPSITQYTYKKDVFPEEVINRSSNKRQRNTQLFI